MGRALRAFMGAWRDLVSPVAFGYVLAAIAIGALVLGLSVAAVVRFAVPVAIDVLPPLPDWASSALQIGAGIGLGVLGFALTPMAAMIAGAGLFDLVCARVERLRFAQDPAGRFVSIGEGLINGLKIAGPALLINLLALPLYLIPGVNLIAFVGVNALLMSREYFSLAALRFYSWDQARALRRRFPVTLMTSGVLLAVTLIVPVIGFVTPLLAAAMMTRLHKALPRP